MDVDDAEDEEELAAIAAERDLKEIDRGAGANADADELGVLGGTVLVGEGERKNASDDEDDDDDDDSDDVGGT